MLEIFTVYFDPSDFPGMYVVRRHVTGVGPDAEPLIVTDTLQIARNAIPAYLVPMDRHPQDDPCILETWL
jgi:hypothetical protein